MRSWRSKDEWQPSFCVSAWESRQPTQLRDCLKKENSSFLKRVRVEGLEPPSLAALDPKSSASTNFATPALFKMAANVGKY
jgi:hypothetical protein